MVDQFIFCKRIVWTCYESVIISSFTKQIKDDIWLMMAEEGGGYEGEGKNGWVISELGEARYQWSLRREELEISDQCRLCLQPGQAGGNTELSHQAEAGV